MSTSSTQTKNTTLKSWSTAIAVFILAVLVNIDYTAVNTALVTIAKEIQVNLNILQWLLSAYVLAWAGFVIPAGQLADIYGAKRMFLLGVALFMFSSIACGLGTTALALISARIVQGFAGALFIPPMYTLIFRAFPKSQQGLALGILSAGMGFGLAIGPTFSGWLLETYSWRWLFYVNVPLCLASMAIVLKSVTTVHVRPKGVRFDRLGALLIMGSIGSFMMGLNQVEEWPLADFRLWALLGGGIFFGLLFWRRQKKSTSPLVPPSLFKVNSFKGCLVGIGALEIIFGFVLVLMGLYLQNIMSYSVYETGNVFLALTIGMGVFSIFGGRVADRIDIRYPICGGLLLNVIGLLMAVCLTPVSSLPYILLLLTFIGLGMGLLMPAVNAGMLKSLDEKYLNTGSGVFATIACIGNGLGVILSTSLWVGLGRILLKGHLVDSKRFSEDLYGQLDKILSGVYRDLSVLQNYSAEATQELIAVVDVSLMASLSWIMGGAALLGVYGAYYCYRTVLIKEQR